MSREMFDGRVKGGEKKQQINRVMSSCLVNLLAVPLAVSDHLPGCDLIKPLGTEAELHFRKAF